HRGAGPGAHHPRLRHHAGGLAAVGAGEHAVEGGGEERKPVVSRAATPGLVGPVVAGALFAAAAELLAALLLVASAFIAPGPAARVAVLSYRSWLAAGGWAWLPLWGAAVGLGWGAWRGAHGWRRAALMGAALALAALPVVWRPAVMEREPTLPRSAAGKVTAL